jgi:hypothetical protein
MESKKTRLHPRNKCDTIYRGYYIYIYTCSKRKIQQEKKQQNRREIEHATNEKENIMTNTKLTCTVVEREEKKTFHII